MDNRNERVNKIIMQNENLKLCVLEIRCEKTGENIANCVKVERKISYLIRTGI